MKTVGSDIDQVVKKDPIAEVLTQNDNPKHSDGPKFQLSLKQLEQLLFSSQQIT